MWDKIKLGEVATFVNGYPFKPSQWSDSGLEIIRIQNLTKSSKESNYFEGEIDNRYKVEKGDILISWSATLGIFEWKGKESWLNQHIFKVVFDKIEIDKKFFIFMIEHVLDDLKKQVHGATMKHITKGNFDNTLVPLPPLSKQKAIAEKLDKADALRKKDQQLLAKYDELAQSLFIDMFGDPVKNDKGWEFSELSKVAPFKKFEGKVLSKDDKFWLLNLDKVKSQTGEVIEKNYVLKEEINNSTSSFNEEQVLYMKLRPYLNKVVLPDESGYATTELVPLNPINTKLDRIFLAYLLRSQSFVKNIEEKVAGAKMPRVSMDTLREFPTILPPLSLQTEFAEKIKNIESQKTLLKIQAQQSEDLFQALLQESFS